MNNAEKFIEIKGIDKAQELIKLALDGEKSVFTWTRQFDIGDMNASQKIEIHIKELKQAVAAYVAQVNT